MGNAITQDARAIWLSLVSEGGWWTANNLRLHWSPTFTELEMVEALSALAGGGFVERREFQCRAQYGFTSSCKQLPGATPSLSINTGALV
jgi:hypothetical protein